MSIEDKQKDDYDFLCSKYSKELVDEEINLELESQEMGYNSFMNAYLKNPAKGTVNSLIRNTVPKYAAALKAFYEEANTGKPGKRHKCISLLKEMDFEVISMIVLKTVFEKCLATITLTKLSVAVGDACEEELRFSRVVETMTAEDRRITLDGLSKRVGLSYKKAFMRAREKYLLDKDNLDRWGSWGSDSKAIVGLKFLEILVASTGFGKFIKSESVDSYKVVYLFQLSDEVLKFIESNNKEIASRSVKYRPMVIPPRNWTTPTDGGYVVNMKSPVKLVRVPYKTLKQVYSDAEMPNVYKAVNAIQGTAWKVNKKVLEVATEVSKWKTLPEGFDFPTIEAQDKPFRAPECNTNPDMANAWKKAVLIYYQLDNQRKSKRLLVNAILDEAETFKDFEAIYFPHNLDFRGRVYPLTTLSPQGNDFNKSLLMFSEGVALGATGHTWLALQGANTYGLDKAKLEDRLTWVYENEAFIKAVAENPLDTCESWMLTDSPWEFLAFCFEWNEYLKSGKSESFKSHLAVALDGSCSGLQHFSAMLRDPVGGKAVNLVPSDEVQDIYKIVAMKVVEDYIKKDLIDGTEDEVKVDSKGNSYTSFGTKSLAKMWMDYGITRKSVKRCVMTIAYSAKKFGFKQQVLSDVIYPALGKENPFKSPSQCASYLADLIWKTVHLVVVKAMEAMKWLQDVARLLAKEKDLDGKTLPVTWVSPSGFPVRQAYFKKNEKQIKSVLSGSLKIFNTDGALKESLGEGSAIRITVKNPSKTDLDSRKQQNGIAPNFIHSNDAGHLVLTVCDCVDKGVNSFALVHDSYGTHAGNTEVLYRSIREVFVDMYVKNDCLESLSEQAKNLLSEKNIEKLPELPKKGTLDIEEVKNSVYAFL